MPEQHPSTGASTTTRLLAGRYRLRERGAVGGMAEVWHATDESLQRPVAVKILKKSLMSNPITVERFRREATAGARLNHANIVGVYDTISEPGLEAIVMELVDGPSLRQRLDASGALDPNEVVGIAQQLLAGLMAAHRAGVVHRDLKPANILLSTDGRVLITDFGIAKAIEPDVIDLTSDDVMLGTAKYLAPEQVTGAPIDARTDLYSLGVVLYECLAGAVPFDAGSEAATALARLHQSPRPIAWVRRDVPIGLADLVDRLLRREAYSRPASALEALAILGTTGGPAPAADHTRHLVRDPTPRDPATRQLVPSSPATGPVPIQATTTVPVSRLDHTTEQPRPKAPKPGTPPTSQLSRVPGTPPPGAPPDAAPRGVHIGVAVILFISLIVVGVVVGTTHTGLDLFRSEKAASSTSAAVTAPGGDAAAQITTPPRGTAVAPGAVVGIVSVRAFDPFGDGRENNNQLVNLIDGNLTTSWSTELYRSRTLAGKPGVGIIIELDGEPATVALDVRTEISGWNAQLFRAAGLGARLSDWGQPLDERRSDSGDTTFQATGSGKYLLLWVTDPGPADPASRTPRYRLTISELQARG